MSYLIIECGEGGHVVDEPSVNGFVEVTPCGTMAIGVIDVGLVRDLEVPVAHLYRSHLSIIKKRIPSDVFHGVCCKANNADTVDAMKERDVGACRME